jgi:TetR/AcrR family transcriptional regulator of autoinduction and epiphytic fitness
LGLESYRRSIRESKQSAILTAAKASFLKNGYSRAAVAEIAREADVSTATLYKHFSSKEDLFATVIREACSDLGGEFASLGEGENTREIFYAAARSYLKAQFDSDANALMRIVIAEVPTTPQVAIDTYEIIIERRRNHLIRAFDLMVERKLLKPHDTAMGVDMIAGMIKEVFVWPALFDADIRLPDNADEILYEAIDIYLGRYAA